MKFIKLFLLVFLFSCAKDEVTIPPPPVYSEFNVTEFDFTVIGSGYDLTTAPDVYIKVFEAGVLIGTSPHIQDTYSAKFTFVNNWIMQYGITYRVEFWDKDDTSPDDFMAALTFSPIKNQNTVSAGSNQVAATVTGFWQ